MPIQVDAFRSRMHDLKTRVAQIGELVPRGSRILYCDIPLHGNFGDVLIMLGTAAFLKQVGASIVDSFAILSPQKLASKQPEGTTWLLHGGGNFGDLWPGHQSFREQVIVGHPSERIISLPQTLYYSSAEALARFARIAAGHRDLHLFWRDHVSYDTARRHFDCHNYLCPDMAHFLWLEGDGASRVEQRKGDLFLIRRDRESGGVPAWVNAHSSEFVDWKELIPERYHFIRRPVRVLDRVGGVTGMRVPTLGIWLCAMHWLLARMVETLRGYDRIVTSRLHAHVLACLVGSKSVLINNSYGKNRAYFDAWTGELGIAECIAPEASGFPRESSCS
jgi:pyruvyl transferase EpsO